MRCHVSRLLAQIHPFVNSNPHKVLSRELSTEHEQQIVAELTRKNGADVDPKEAELSERLVVRDKGMVMT